MKSVTQFNDERGQETLNPLVSVKISLKASIRLHRADNMA